MLFQFHVQATEERAKTADGFGSQFSSSKTVTARPACGLVELIVKTVQRKLCGVGVTTQVSGTGIERRVKDDGN